MLLIASRRHLFGGALIPEIPLILLCDAPIWRCHLYTPTGTLFTKLCTWLPTVYFSCLHGSMLAYLQIADFQTPSPLALCIQRSLCGRPDIAMDTGGHSKSRFVTFNQVSTFSDSRGLAEVAKGAGYWCRSLWLENLSPKFCAYTVVSVVSSSMPVQGGWRLQNQCSNKESTFVVLQRVRMLRLCQRRGYPRCWQHASQVGTALTV